MKKKSRNLTALLLSAALLAGIAGAMPAKTQAAEKHFCYIAMSCMDLPSGFPEGGDLYRFSEWDTPQEINNSWGGASYDPGTNTLTLNNFNHPETGFTFDMMGLDNFDTELKIVLKGSNAVQSFWCGDDIFSIEGSGSLTVNGNKTAEGPPISWTAYKGDDHRNQLRIGKDATVTILRSADTEYAKGYCLSINDIDPDQDKPEDYLSYGGTVSPQISWTTEKTDEGTKEGSRLTDKLCVRTDFPVSRLFADKNDPNAIRLLMEGKVEDSDETYAWLEKQNGKWYVSKHAGYEPDISGPYTGTIPEDLKKDASTITAYLTANSVKTSLDDFSTSFFVYRKDGKHYAIAAECMLVDEWSAADAASDVYYMGEIVQEQLSPSYDAWLMDSFTKAEGVSTGAQADQYMADHGYEKIEEWTWPPTYAFLTGNDMIKFSPAASPAPAAPTGDSSKGDSQTTPPAGSTDKTDSGSSAATPSPAPAAPADGSDPAPVQKGESVTDAKTGAAFTVTTAAAGKIEVAFKAPKSSKGKTFKIPSKISINGTEAAVTSIAAGAFKNNKKLTSVTIPATVKKIGGSAFKGCVKLSKVTIPKGVTEIGASAFYGCKKLKKATIKSTTIKKIGKSAFKGVPKKASFKVPKKQKKAYKKLLKKGGYKGKVK